MTAPFRHATPGPGSSLPHSPLRLYSRQGCCLCEGLQERLEALQPPPPLEVVDVDADPALQARYGLRVPVLAVPVLSVSSPQATESSATEAWRELPPVPPRLATERLRAWLEGHGAVGGAAAPAGPPPATGP